MLFTDADVLQSAMAVLCCFSPVDVALAPLMDPFPSAAAGASASNLKRSDRAQLLTTQSRR